MRIEMVKIGANGEHLPPDSTEQHEAVFLPQFGLMFTARVINKEEKDQRALEADCKAVACAGFSDWDMPEIDELQLIVDRTRHDPALDPEFFPGVPSDCLWSKTAAAWSLASAWYVYAYGGSVDFDHRDTSGFAVAVRRVGQ